MTKDAGILITGATGLIGTRLRNHLFSEKMQYSILSRNSVKLECPVFQWNPEENAVPPNAFNNVHTIVNLAGTGIADKKWSEKRKKEILRSRVDGLDTLYNSLKSGDHSVKTLVSASAIGFYGNSGITGVDESRDAGNDFLGKICREWEEAAMRFEKLGIRVVILRIGFVLAKDGGALPVLKKQVGLFAGSAFGTGEQIISWIHIDDVCQLILQSIRDDKMNGVYNAVASFPVTNKEFIRSIAHTMHRPFWPIPVPAFMLRLILGEKADIVLFGQNVSNKKVLNTGYKFLHSDLKESLQTLM
ncbi:MAG: TIGR01777 family protein [Bacteroidetes bacterium]|nr:TIGR01777 family protein [Bacteroidota bacterium]